MTEPNPNQESALEAARDLSQLAAVEIVSLHAVDLMTAAAVKLGLFEGGDQMRDLAEARILIDGATKKSNDMGIPMCIAVTDEAGDLITFDRMDGGKISSISIAIDKAFTAAAARNPTHVYNQLCQPGQPTFGIHVTNEGHFCIIGGGFPVKVNGTDRKSTRLNSSHTDISRMPSSA